MSAITPFTVSETEQVSDVLYNRLYESPLYKKYLEIFKGKHNSDDLYKMFNELVVSVKYDTKLLSDFKDRYDYWMIETVVHRYEDYETYSKWEYDVKKMRADTVELMSNVIVYLYRKMKSNH